MVRDDATYQVQEIIHERVHAELDVIGGVKAIAKAKNWNEYYCVAGQVRVICDGELVWPNPLRCSTCGAYLKKEGASCPTSGEHP
jgi:hypothetical protein